MYRSTYKAQCFLELILRIYLILRKTDREVTEVNRTRTRTTSQYGLRKKWKYSDTNSIGFISVSLNLLLKCYVVI